MLLGQTSSLAGSSESSSSLIHHLTINGRYSQTANTASPESHCESPNGSLADQRDDEDNLDDVCDDSNNNAMQLDMDQSLIPGECEDGDKNGKKSANGKNDPFVCYFPIGIFYVNSILTK